MQSPVGQPQRLGVIVALSEFAENLLIGEVRRIPVLSQESLRISWPSGYSFEAFMIRVSPYPKKQKEAKELNRRQQGTKGWGWVLRHG